jgi:DNA-nicking Smr family endonuclease
MKRGDSINSIYTVLSNLPDFVKDKNIPLRESPHDEKFLYAEAMEGVHKISHDKSLIKRPAESKIRHIKAEENPRYLLEEAVKDKQKFNVTNMPEYMEGYAEGTNPVTMDKLKNGEFSIQRNLDLHGFSIENAKLAFEQFLSDSIKAGLNCVKVVHGRGLKSKSVPVLKENLKMWIVRAMNRKWVTAFSSARMCDGGPGATYILLKKIPVKKRIHILG